MLLSLSGPWLWYRFLRELQPSRDSALAGWVIFAALPSWSVIYSYFMQESLMLPLLGGALWATWRCRRKADTASFLLATLAWMLAGLTRGICIPLAAVAMTWLWITQDGKAAKAAWSLVLLLGVLTPLAGRSWYLARQISPHGLGTMNQLYSRAGVSDFSIDFSRSNGKEHWAYQFQSPAMNVAPFEPFSTWSSSRLGHAHFSIDLDHGQRDWQAARDSLPPWTLRRAAWLTGDNLILLFFTDSWPDTNHSRSIGLVNHWLRWVWVPLAMVCLVLTLAFRKRQRERLLPTLILAWFLVQGLLPLAVNEGRYRKPFEGLLIAQCILLASRTSPRRKNAESLATDGPARESEIARV